MYLSIPQTVKCSKCGCINHYEDVTRGNAFGGSMQQTIRRCLNASCKHESVISTLTTNVRDISAARGYHTLEGYKKINNNEKTF